jgi:SAM-dependent methyltransferase
MKRVVKPELLDEDSGTAAQITASLRDLQRINRWFGGSRTTLQLLRRIAQVRKCARITLLEIGAGQGYPPLMAEQSLAAAGVKLEVVLLDKLSSHLPQNGTPVIAADAMRLPFRDGTFDVVSSNLFAHHFEPDALQLLTNESLRVARVGVLINDLIRSPIHLALTYAALPLFRSPLTWHDGPASVRRAYTLDEMRDILSQTTARRVEISSWYLYRMGVLLWK